MTPLQYGKVDAGSVITLTVSSGLGDINTVNIFVDLPSDVEDSVDMTVIVDGAVDSQNSKTLVPKYNKTYTLELKGSGTSSVVIQLDGQAYREYSVDFATTTVTTLRHMIMLFRQPLRLKQNRRHSITQIRMLSLTQPFSRLRMILNFNR